VSVFGEYARYYDLLYRDKHYDEEARFVYDLLRSHGPGASTVLELGCGTAAHAACLADLGCEVRGVDRSLEMLDQGRARLETLPATLSRRITLSQGDVRTVRLDRVFDAVVSLFHVMSYQPTGEDLEAAFRTAKEHLRPDGLFLFDCWYGPSVLAERPAVRVKRFEDDETAVTRIAEPSLDPTHHLVDVDYTIFVRQKANGEIREIREKHRLRYLFQEEVAELFSRVGFRFIECREWLTRRPPGLDTWNIYFVGRA
jgi:SAM-dependent methyltransferase